MASLQVPFWMRTLNKMSELRTLNVGQQAAADGASVSSDSASFSRRLIDEVLAAMKLSSKRFLEITLPPLL